jgi:hypothetical protein
MFFSIFHQVRATLTLHRDGVCFSAGPNRRAIIEYILALAWLVDDGESVVDVLNRSLQNDQKLMATQLRKNSMLDGFPEQTRMTLSETVAVPLEPHPDERLMKPSNLIEMYDSTLKPYYGAESRFSHVSLTAIQFFSKARGDDLALSQTPNPPEPMPCQDFCLHALSQAMLTFNELLIGRPWTSDLAQLSTEFNLDTRRPTRKSAEN